VAPVFTHRNVLALAPAMTRTAARACDRLKACGGRAEMVGEMLTATFDVICDVALSGREHFDAHTFGQAITEYFRTAGRASLLDFLGFPDWFPRPGELLAGRSVKTMHEMVGAAIEARRRQSDAPADDLLAHMLEAQDPETGQRMDPQALIFNMQFFIVAGHETTALALAWSLYLLAHAPQEQEKARAQAQGVLQGHSAGPDDLAAMPFIRQVLEEAMRLYPPVGLLARNVRQLDMLCGRDIRPGDVIFLPIYALHRHELWWRQPNAFDPDNFSATAVKERDRYLYLPFGAGPRGCVGASFAMMQAQIILATLLARFRFEPGPYPPPVPVMLMTMRPEPGVRLRIAAA
jgi:cytochrome P450